MGGMYPTAAGQIATHGPYKQVSDLYEIKGLPDSIKDIMKKYEGNFVVLPANEAYFIDRINNGMYRRVQLALCCPSGFYLRLSGSHRQHGLRFTGASGSDVGITAS